MKFSTEQKRAIYSNAQYIRLLACAGSGKTTVLIQRLVYLLRAGRINPEHVAIITFTKLAADELVLRLGKQIDDKKILSQLFIGTIHSFCLHLLQDFYVLSSQDTRVLTENQRFVLLNLKWEDWGIDNIAKSSNRSDFLLKLITTLDIRRMERIPDEHIENFSIQLLSVIRNYESYLNENNFVDYTEMLTKVNTLLEVDKEFNAKVRNKYRYLFVDEYQDVDPIQQQLIHKIGDNQSLFVVGDDDQAIYQFRGTDVSGFINFSRLYTDADLCSLTVNRRCKKNILSIAENIIKENKSRTGKEMHSKDDGGKVYCLEFPTVTEEADFVAQEIKRLNQESHIPYNEIAILFRSVASSGTPFINAFENESIPYTSKGNHALFSQREIVEIVNCLEFIAKQDEDINNIAFLRPVIGNLPILSEVDQHSFDSYNLELFRQFGLSNEEYSVFLKILEIRSRYLLGKFDSFIEIVDWVIDLLGILQTERESVFYNIALLTRIVGEFEEIEQTKKLHRLCAFFSMYASKTIDEATPLEQRFETVNLLTIHQAKGLEFSAVFCPMLVERRFPNTISNSRWLIPDNLFDSARYLNSIEDERRLFYVAITRAKYFAYLSCSSDIGLKKLVAPSEFFIKSKNCRLRKYIYDDKIILPDRNDKDGLVTSYSSLEYYISCPYRYKLHKKYGFQPPGNPFFEFGRVIHLVAGLLHHMYLDERPITEKLIEELYLANFKMRYRVPNYVLERRKRDGLSAILSYWHNYKSYFENCAGVETPFSYYSHDALIKGKIDLLVHHSSGSEIIDFKTGHPNEALHRNFQMQVYSLASINQLGLNITKASLLYLEHNHLDTFEVTPSFLESGEQTLSSLISRINSEDFRANPGAFCTRCEYRQICIFSAKG